MERVNRQQLVQNVAARLREMVAAKPPEAHLGSLNGIARALGVGIVTVQQAARILEHEGLLAVRRGPGGGYFGTRPDAASLERSMEAYLGVHRSSFLEGVEMLTLLDCELMPAAAKNLDEAGRARLEALLARVDACDGSEARVEFEDRFHEALFAIVERPLMEILATVIMRNTKSGPIGALFPGEEGIAAWKDWRRRIITAILDGDAELARFEARRHREDLLRRLAAAQQG